jgi:DinB superfamily
VEEASSAGAGGIVKKEEREFVLLHLAESRERLVEAVQGLSAEQLRFRPAEDRWSVADCVEHVTVLEAAVFKLLQKSIQTPPDPGKETQRLPEANVSRMDRIILERLPLRDVPAPSPSDMLPSGRWPDFEELMRQFEATRERSLRFAAVTQADLRSHFLPHPLLGPLDGYQWLLFFASHCERHVRQLEDVKNDARFPRGLATSA